MAKWAKTGTWNKRSPNNGGSTRVPGRAPDTTPAKMTSSASPLSRFGARFMSAALNTFRLRTVCADFDARAPIVLR